MDIKEFRAGIYKKQYKYKSFMPAKIHMDWHISDTPLINLLSGADLKLGELNSYTQLIPDVDFFVKMHAYKEATLSSRIEGTRTNFSEALQKAEYIDPEKRDDWQEIQNYVEAMNGSIKLLNKLPLSNRLLKDAHSILMKGVRGKHKQPGEFRKSQNWIGGASLNDAVYIPPAFEDLPELMGDLEKFLNDETYQLPHLIKIGMAHYQFETIHPFLDGNGKVGRLLITLYLVDKKLLSGPTLYLSAFFEKNRSLYYDNLTIVRAENNLTQWLKFFLEGVRQTAENSIETFKKIIKLREDIENKKVISLGKKIKLAKQFLNYLYGNPVVSGGDTFRQLKVNPSTALRLIGDFERLGILKEVTAGKRNRIFVFKEYMELFEK